jgi:hypothetical protein
MLPQRKSPSHSIFTALRPLLEPGSTPLLFIIGVVLLNVVSNAAYEIIGTISNNPVRIIVIAFGLLFLLAIVYALIRRFFHPKISVTDIVPCPALITLVSQGVLKNIPAYHAVQYHRNALKHCWLVTSPQPPDEPNPPVSTGGNQSAWMNAQDLKTSLEQDQIKVSMVEINPEDPENIFESIDGIYKEARRAGIDEQQIVADFTGGTKMMTVGMVLACTSAGRAVEYMKPREFFADGRANPAAGSDPKIVDLGFLVKWGTE